MNITARKGAPSRSPAALEVDEKELTLMKYQKISSTTARKMAPFAF